MDSRLYWIWLQQALGEGSPLSGPVLQAFGRPEAVYEAGPREWEESGLAAGAGIPKGTAVRLADKSMAKAEDIFRRTLEAGDWLLTPDDSLYPSLLRGIFALPLVIYGRGEWPNLDMVPALAIVGSRRSTPYGEETAARLAAGLTAGGMIVVSGGAVGIDAAANGAAVGAGGPTIAVMGGGLDQEYPRENAPLRQAILAAGGAVVTEYPPGTPPLGGHFPVRNRILSGLCLGVCVVEATGRSGALITARHAVEQGRDVFSVPGDITAGRSVGANTLIQQGARLVRSAAEILEEYRDRYPGILDVEAAEAARPRPWDGKGGTGPVPAAPRRAKKTEKKAAVPKKTAKPAVCPPGVSPQAARVFAVLTREPLPVDDLATRASLEAAAALAALTELEMAGGACSQAGQRYTLPAGD